MSEFLEDFWDRYGNGYRLFSHFCDYNDWQLILKAIADAIHSKRDSGADALSILDVGAGAGHNIQAILELLYTRSGIRHNVDLIEPSRSMRENISRIIAPAGDGGFLGQIYPSLAHIDRRRFHRVIFMHSAYYLGEFSDVLRKLRREHMESNCRLIFLCLPYASPFFKVADSALPNCAEDLVTVLGRYDFRITRTQLRSSFKFDSKRTSLTESGVQHLRQFMRAPAGLSDAGFLKIMSCTADRGVDLEDQLIVAEQWT